MTAFKHHPPLLLSIISLLFFSSCGEESPQKTKDKDSQPEPIVKRDTSWTDGKITRLSSSKRGNDVISGNDRIEREFIRYSPNKDSASATISIHRETSTYNFGERTVIKSLNIATEYSIAIDSFRGLDLFDEKNTLIQSYSSLEYNSKDGETKAIVIKGSTKNYRGEHSFNPKVIPAILEKERNKKIGSKSSYISRSSFMNMNGDYLFSYTEDSQKFNLLADSIVKKLESLPEHFITSYYTEY
ncbi:hypothetical protein SapgrDRAFT_1137 [Saprospira grandis DSM 2844]|uniref:Lipoprotein n=1 Tax=Saprospira grandis DSM 2844 TaxID=694433 RepID=J0P5X5_9BACT|nr:hypothetical protein [Saprospira grandis]EJF52862.1 hypothetical protein SapgrDRAFT_1137 [Saprospira grandis DSM 2844]